MDLELQCVPPEVVHQIWAGEICDLIDAGFAASDVPMPENLLEQLRYGTRQLWLAATPCGKVYAAMLTQLFEMRSGRVLKMMECGGTHLRDWMRFRTEIEQYAKREGCNRVLVEGRGGWSRVLNDYRIVSMTLEKRI